MIQYQQHDEDVLPVIWQITAGNDVETDIISAWLTDHRPIINAILNTQGALLIRGFSKLKTAPDFERAITSISPALRDYIGGTSPREKVHGKIMTATHRPSSWSIILHQEMSYTKNPPARIAFFCVQPATTGGYSLLGNMRQITKKIAPHILEKFQTHGVQLQRTLPSLKTRDKKIGLQKSWEEVFDTTDQSRVAQIAQEKNWQITWLDQNELQLRQEILPATKLHPVCKAEVWFNQTHGFEPVCLMEQAKRDGRLEDYEQLAKARKFYPHLLDRVLYGSGEFIADDDALYIDSLHHESEINVALEAFDLLILDNTLVAHGRSPFTGKREILVALMENHV